MSRKLRIIICSVLVLIAFGAGIFAYAHTQIGQSDNAVAEESLPDFLIDKYGKIPVPEEPTAAELGGADPRDSRGTEGNPFFVLELVPYDGMAAFGYQIDGCEPIDVHAAARDGVDVPFQSSSNYYAVEPHTFRFWKGEEPESFRRNQIEKITQYGKMTYVGDGSGNYKMTSAYTAGDDLTKETYAKVGNSEDGDYLWEPLSAEDCAGMTYEQSTEYRGTYTGDRTIGTSYKMFFEQVECYVNYSGEILTHQNTFLKESVGLAYEFDANGVRHRITDENVIKQRIEDYHSVVYTVTPEDLNFNPELVRRADMLVISGQCTTLPVGSGLATYLQEEKGDTSMFDGSGKYTDKYKYIPYFKKHLLGYEATSGNYVRKENKVDATFDTNLLDWSIVVEIYKRAADETHKLPILTDWRLYQNVFSSTTNGLIFSDVELKVQFSDGVIKDTTSNKNGTQNNITKLFLMLYQMKTPLFQSLYGDPSDSSNPWFSTTDMKKVSNGTTITATKFTKKDGTPLKTGVFNYDNGRSSNKGTSESRTFWHDLTLLPWHLMPEKALNEEGQEKESITIEIYSKLMAVLGIGVDSGNGINIISGDAQNSIRNGVMAYFGDTKTTTGLDSVACGVKNNEFGSQLYEYFDAINGDDPAPPETGTVEEGALSTADCLFYLLGGINGGPTPLYSTKQYKILELQPSSNYETDTDADFWNQIIVMYTDSVEDPVVDTMTTSEFIGSHVECISEYDLIYIGMKKSTDDPTMNFTGGTNFVYAHTGPKMTVSSTFSALYGWLRSGKEGLSDDDYNEREQYFAYSGNDLTDLALAKLEKYNEAGLPILFADGFFSNDFGESYAMANTIDRNSNVYKLGGIIDDAGTNAIDKGDLILSVAKTEKFRQLLTSNNNKVKMVFSSKPVIYNSDVTNEQDRYINGYSPNYRVLRYEFYVDAPAGQEYTVNLYVDSNTDGYYASGENVGAQIFYASGTSVGNGKVKGGQSYIVQRQIENRIGSICWKLDLVKDGKIYASESGVSAIKASTADEIVPIKVLQILPKPVDPDNNSNWNNPNTTASLILPTEEDIANNTASEAAKLFHQKINELDDFDITFTHMTQTEVLEKINGTPTTEADPDYLYQNYDMLVLGFADIYNGVSDATLIAKIENYIGRGKAVLYTHDTSSGIGNTGTNSLPVWGKNVTEAYRDMFGMDRYGAKAYFDSGDFDDISDTKDIPYAPRSSSSIAQELYTNGYGKHLIQGASNGIIYRANYTTSEWMDSDPNVNAYEVSKVNRGAITEYPFTIEDSISVATTHPQYYQLDMEQEDIVVWFCLDGGTAGKSKDYETKFFGQNKNDVRNNYYIYNKGNVTYSGMGHMISGDAADLKVDEIELFVNTFVAAYRAAAVGVKVEVTNDDATSNSAGDQFLCVEVDSSNGGVVIGDIETDIVDHYHLLVPNGTNYEEGPEIEKTSKRVYFRLNDRNVFSEPEYKVTMKLDGADVMLAVYDSDDDDEPINPLTDCVAATDEIYYVDVPIHMDVNAVTGDEVVGKTVLEITVDMTYLSGEERVSAEPSTTKVNILPRGFYRLH